jgi:ketosteroid isomerase-like protein
MSEVDDFVAKTAERTGESVVAGLFRSNPEPFISEWSRRNPVSVFGAWGPCKQGWSELERIFRWVASRFSNAEMTTQTEVAYLGGELAYWVGYELGEAAIDGIRQPVKLRVTHIYRREHDEWKLVHRHGDFAPVDQSPAASA